MAQWLSHQMRVTNHSDQLSFSAIESLRPLQLNSNAPGRSRAFRTRIIILFFFSPFL
uniref:Uncharacterized protein n=1 Tax=Arundo donax TaxID=35708 RepID=A0A0A8ZQ12_ARUDO